MQELQLSRQRNGAYGWALARDLSDPELWIERFHFPTWTDFLRHRNRPTSAERELQERIKAFHSGSGPIQIRRMLERPFGSRSEEHTSELQSLMRISYAVFCLKKKQQSITSPQ